MAPRGIGLVIIAAAVVVGYILSLDEFRAEATEGYKALPAIRVHPGSKFPEAVRPRTRQAVVQ
jgi:hypothetical protein